MRHGTAVAAEPAVPVPVAERTACDVSGSRMVARRWVGPASDGDGERRGPPVVLVHGLVIAGDLVAPLAERLAPEFRVHAPDLPGFGESTLGSDAGAMTVPELGAALASWADRAVGEPAAFLGVSFGCQVVAEVAMTRRDLVDRLVLVSPTLDPQARADLGDLVHRWLREQSTQSFALRRRMARAYLAAGIARAVATVDHMRSDRLEDRLPWIDAPTLVVRGTEDPVCTASWARDVVDGVPNGRLATAWGAPHAMTHDRALALARIVRPFLTAPSGSVASGSTSQPRTKGT